MEPLVGQQHKLWVGLCIQQGAHIGEIQNNNYLKILHWQQISHTFQGYHHHTINICIDPTPSFPQL